MGMVAGGRETAAGQAGRTVPDGWTTMDLFGWSLHPPRRRQGLLTCMAAAAIVTAVPPPAAADPALFVVHDSDSTVYLYGTFHILKQGTEWLTPAVLKALRESDDLWLEVDLAAETGGTGSNFASYGASPALPLSTRLPPDVLDRVKAAAADAGLPFAALDGMRPWLAAVTLSQQAMARVGFTEAGPDAQFALFARDAGMPTHGFETADQQLRYFADLKPAAEISMLKSTLDDLDEGPSTFEEAASAWKAGDLDLLKVRAVDEIMEMGEDVYATLIVNRNRRFAEGIATIMEGAGTHFVAVGTAHLVGPDSVQAFLEQRGLPSERVDRRPEP